MRAYLDMVIHDSEFVQTVNFKLTSTDILKLKNIFKPEKTEHVEINILDAISEATQELAKEKRVSTDVKDTIAKLFAAIKLW